MTESKTWVQRDEAKLQLGCGADGDEGVASQGGSGSFIHLYSQHSLSPRWVPGVVQGLGIEHEVGQNHAVTSQTVSHGGSVGKEAVLDGESETMFYGEASMLTHLVVLPSQSQFRRKSSLLSLSPPSQPGSWCSKLFIICSFGWKVGHRHAIRNFSLGFSFWMEGRRSSDPSPASHWLLRGSTSSRIFVPICSEGAGSMSSGLAGTVCHGSWEA